MKRLPTGLLCVCLVACSAQPDESLIMLPDCNKLRASGDFEITIMSDDVNTLHLAGNGVDQFEWLHDGTTLLLSTNGPNQLRVNLSCVKLTEIELLGSVQAQQSPDGFAQYDKVAVYGSSSFTAVELNADLLDLRTSGQGALRLDQIVADQVQVLASGQSQQYLAGETQRLQATLTGNAKLSSAALSAQRIALSASGDTVAEVFPTAHIGGTLSGRSALWFVSNPVLEVALEIQDAAVAYRRE